MSFTRAKGNRYRNSLIELLERKGLNVGIVERTGRFVTPKDLYSLFDLIALSDDGEVQLIQNSSYHPHVHKTLDDFKKRYKNLVIRQYFWKDSRHYARYTYRGDGTWEKKEFAVKTAEKTLAKKKSTLMEPAGE